MVNSGKNYIGDVVDAALESIVKSGNFKATTDYSLAASAEYTGFVLQAYGDLLGLGILVVVAAELSLLVVAFTVLSIIFRTFVSLGDVLCFPLQGRT